MLKCIPPKAGETATQQVVLPAAAEEGSDDQVWRVIDEAGEFARGDKIALTERSLVRGFGDVRRWLVCGRASYQPIEGELLGQ